MPPSNFAGAKSSAATNLVSAYRAAVPVCHAGTQPASGPRPHVTSYPANFVHPGPVPSRGQRQIGPGPGVQIQNVVYPGNANIAMLNHQQQTLLSPPISTSPQYSSQGPLMISPQPSVASQYPHAPHQQHIINQQSPMLQQPVFASQQPPVRPQPPSSNRPAPFIIHGQQQQLLANPHNSPMNSQIPIVRPPQQIFSPQQYSVAPTSPPNQPQPIPYRQQPIISQTTQQPTVTTVYSGQASQSFPHQPYPHVIATPPQQFANSAQQQIIDPQRQIVYIQPPFNSSAHPNASYQVINVGQQSFVEQQQHQPMPVQQQQILVSPLLQQQQPFQPQAPHPQQQPLVASPHHPGSPQQQAMTPHQPGVLHQHSMIVPHQPFVHSQFPPSQVQTQNHPGYLVPNTGIPSLIQPELMPGQGSPANCGVHAQVQAQNPMSAQGAAQGFSFQPPIDQQQTINTVSNMEHSKHDEERFHDNNAISEPSTTIPQLEDVNTTEETDNSNDTPPSDFQVPVNETLSKEEDELMATDDTSSEKSAEEALVIDEANSEDNNAERGPDINDNQEPNKDPECQNPINTTDRSEENLENCHSLPNVQETPEFNTETTSLTDNDNIPMDGDAPSVPAPGDGGVADASTVNPNPTDDIPDLRQEFLQNQLTLQPGQVNNIHKELFYKYYL